MEVTAQHPSEEAQRKPHRNDGRVLTVVLKVEDGHAASAWWDAFRTGDLFHGARLSMMGDGHYGQEKDKLEERVGVLEDLLEEHGIDIPDEEDGLGVSDEEE